VDDNAPMPITVVPHDIPNQVMAVVTGEIAVGEMMAFVKASRIGERRSWAFILDTSGAAVAASSADLQNIADFAAEEFKKSAIGPVAFVSSDPGTFGMGRVYQAYSSASGRSNVGVFKTLDDAQRWLSRIKVGF
jgi:hypothetical protein